MFFITNLFLFLPAIAGSETESTVKTASSQLTESSNVALLAIAAAGAVGISCITSAFALAKIGSAAMGAMSEKPEIGGRAIVFLGMAEGIAIYGLIIAIMILNKI
ncbi:MAG: F0F1 ATP synthase subunit C [Spirochaetes bacterium]|nr:F0F1 ATP synthase subunit C [Spirochaetota bacterium]